MTAAAVSLHLMSLFWRLFQVRSGPLGFPSALGIVDIL